MENSFDKKLAQQIVATVKDVCGQNVNFIDRTGMIYASTDERRIGSFHEIGKQAAEKGEMLEVDTDSLFAGTQKGVNLPVFHNGSFVAVIGISGPPDQVRKYAYLAERITGLLIRERELNTFSRTQAEKMNYVIHSLINRENLSQAYLLDTLEQFHVNKNGSYRILLIHIHSGRTPMNTAEAEQNIQQMFAKTGITLCTFHYPSEYLAVMDSSRFPLISPV
ncbi:sugar diacid utilization regulator SdaR, partial [Blautia pseudococcoides]|nr:sugar diacid utilization regulator SdaR [Blautia pseudococcoides]